MESEAEYALPKTYRHTHTREQESDLGKVLLVCELSLNLLGFILLFPLSLSLYYCLSNANQIPLLSPSLICFPTLCSWHPALRGNDTAAQWGGNTLSNFSSSDQRNQFIIQQTDAAPSWQQLLLLGELFKIYPCLPSPLTN